MVKIFSILTLLVSIAAAYLGFESKNLAEAFRVRADKEYADHGSTKAKLKKTEETLASTEADLKMTKEDLEKTKATLVSTMDELTKAKDEVTATKAMLTEKETKLAELQKIIDDLPKPDPNDPKAGDLKTQITEMQGKIVAAEAKVQTLEKEKAELTTTVETLTANKNELQAKIEPMKKEIIKYKEGIIQEGLTGRVLAVNSGWGFCVLNIGDSKGAAANRTLIVRRGGQAIGRVKITAVERTQSVADIISNSFPTGIYVQPGDEVIYNKGSEGVRNETGDGAGGGGNAVPPLPLPN